jgi:hypothetical protein
MTTAHNMMTNQHGGKTDACAGDWRLVHMVEFSALCVMDCFANLLLKVSSQTATLQQMREMLGTLRLNSVRI